MTRRISIAILLLCLVLTLARSAEAQWAIDVEWAVNADATSATTITFTYANPVASGALLACFIVGANVTNGVVTGVEDDSANGSWSEFGGTVIPVVTPLGHAWNAFYYLNSAAATPVVTATFTGASTNRGIICGSYTPTVGTTFSFDVGSGLGQTNPNTGTDAVHTNDTGSTAVANELAISATIMQAGVTITEGTGWTERLDTAFGAFLDVQVQDRNVASPATVRGTWTISSAAADPESIVGVFKESAASGAKNLLMLGVGGR